MCLLSIAIPTRNRSEYLQWTLRGLAELDSHLTEIVISDNSDCDAFNATVKCQSPNRNIVYRHNAGPWSSTRNFAEAMRLSRGKYLCIIGDDDIVTNDIIRVCLWADKNHVDSIFNYRLATTYAWPDVHKTGKLEIDYSDQPLDWINPRKEVDNCLLSAGIGMQRMPKVYLGIIRRECIADYIKTIEAAEYGTCPDMFWAVIASHVAKTCAVLDYPVIVPGASAKSTAGDVARRTHEGELHQAPHLRERGNYDWLELVPEFYSLETFWSDSAIKALKRLEKYESIEQLNYALLYITCYIRHKEYRARTWEAWQKFIARNQRHLIRTMLTESLKLMRFGYFKSRKIAIAKMRHNPLIVEGLENNYTAKVALERYLSSVRPQYSLERKLASAVA